MRHDAAGQGNGNIDPSARPNEVNFHNTIVPGCVDDSAFTINAAYQSAMMTIAAHERTFLQPADHAAFFDALDNPPEPTDKLTAAFKRHSETVVSK